MPQFVRALHVALTIRDQYKCAAWYWRVLRFEVVKEFVFEPDELGIPRIPGVDS
jgi:catechol 2,3-dioxygenase-like lactoylglutathione lyase family enzyme